MRKSLGVCLLVLLLTGSAAAGEMPNPAPDTLTQTVLDLLAVLPSLF